MPLLTLYNRQRQYKPNLLWLRKIIKAALPLCVAEAKSSEVPLMNLEEIEFTITSDDEISRVHAEFLDDPTPTDVITFHHGEILVSADTAVRQGSDHGQSLDQELALYLIHGMMHLGGWDDHEESEAKEMTVKQEAILKQVSAKLQ